MKKVQKNQIGKNYFRYTWTKESLKSVINLWESKTLDEISKELGVNIQNVIYIASRIRKAGYDLPRKKKRGTVDLLIKEVIKEL